MGSDIFDFEFDEHATVKPHQDSNEAGCNAQAADVGASTASRSLHNDMLSLDLPWSLSFQDILPDVDNLPWLDSTNAAWQPWLQDAGLHLEHADEAIDNASLLNEDFLFDDDWRHTHPGSTNSPALDLCGSVPEQARPLLLSEMRAGVETTPCSAQDANTSKELLPDDVSATKIKSKRKRTRISEEARLRLEQEFLIKPYPVDEAIITLALQTALPVRTVKTWFSNARRRKRVAEGETEIMEPHYLRSLNTSDAPSTTISAANLDALNRRASPAPSNASMNRYLSTSLSEEPVRLPSLPVAAIPTSPRQKSARHDASPIPLPTPPITIPSPAWPMSHMGSVGSDRSMLSIGSHMSIDSRGSRKGRRAWKPAQESSPYMTQPNTQDVHTYALFLDGCPRLSISPAHASDAIAKSEMDWTEPDDKTAQKPYRYFCTWPECESKFRHRFEWERHEEALHYLPYQWVCCSSSDIETTAEGCFALERKGCYASGADHSAVNHPVLEAGQPGYTPACFALWLLRRLLRVMGDAHRARIQSSRRWSMEDIMDIGQASIMFRVS
ncbi:hypothetical protein EK21DRAFT_91289 [Setomelanomma holmii]|uniref:Homeobox domain-containing protein n=1 Tax=Setomelanomma holmii TaxID=210430 RepID=A0A9P4LI64_9PLEO|nr:hypothetical protein EK21DRAFT_91289 [Setomelanomma holmii]